MVRGARGEHVQIARGGVCGRAGAEAATCYLVSAVRCVRRGVVTLSTRSRRATPCTKPPWDT
eukprot:555284-Prymnesium_polylepis.3